MLFLGVALGLQKGLEGEGLVRSYPTLRNKRVCVWINAEGLRLRIVSSHKRGHMSHIPSPN